ncbi:hypothetical protein [Megamonas funiformis]|uniref:hypothetical protein n=1 Tax=Megamonas funiformis TaxID=437897 RepID=UPI001EF61A89
MFKNYIENANFEDTGFSYTLSLIRGKYKMVILYCLMEFNIVRYNEVMYSHHFRYRLEVGASCSIQLLL